MMCNLSDGAEMRGIDKGMMQALLGYIKKMKVSIDAALEDHDITAANREKYIVLLREHLQS